MAEEEVVDAESSTLNKQVGPVDHLRHLINVGWKPNQPIIQKFVEQYGLDEELKEICQEFNVS